MHTLVSHFTSEHVLPGIRGVQRTQPKAAAHHDSCGACLCTGKCMQHVQRLNQTRAAASHWLKSSALAHNCDACDGLCLHQRPAKVSMPLPSVRYVSSVATGLALDSEPLQHMAPTCAFTLADRRKTFTITPVAQRTQRYHLHSFKFHLQSTKVLSRPRAPPPRITPAPPARMRD